MTLYCPVLRTGQLIEWNISRSLKVRLVVVATVLHLVSSILWPNRSTKRPIERLHPWIIFATALNFIDTYSSSFIQNYELSEETKMNWPLMTSMHLKQQTWEQFFQQNMNGMNASWMNPLSKNMSKTFHSSPMHLITQPWCRWQCLNCFTEVCGICVCAQASCCCRWCFCVQCMSNQHKGSARANGRYGCIRLYPNRVGRFAKWYFSQEHRNGQF